MSLIRSLPVVFSAFFILINIYLNLPFNKDAYFFVTLKKEQNLLKTLNSYLYITAGLYIR